MNKTHKNYYDCHSADCIKSNLWSLQDIGTMVKNGGGIDSNENRCKYVILV